MRLGRLFLVWAAVAAIPAAAVVVDDFETETLGDLNGQNGWTISINQSGGTFQIENTHALQGAQSVAVLGANGLVAEYKHDLTPSTDYTMTWSFEATAALNGAYPGLYVCNGDDLAEAWGVWVLDNGEVRFDSVSGWTQLVATVATGVAHQFRVVVMGGGSVSLYIDGAASPAFVNNTIQPAIDRVMISLFPAASSAADQAYWDDITLTPTPPAISTVLTATGGVGVGSPLGYRIDVTNVGTVAIDGLTVVDTLPSGIVNVTPGQPGGFGPPTITPVAGGDRYEWAATGLGFAPGATLTFTLDGAPALVCAPTAFSTTAFAVATTSAAASAAAFSGAAGAVIYPPLAGLSISQVQTLSGTAVGSSVTYEIIVSNTGSATIQSLNVVDTVQPEVTGIVQSVVPPGGFTSDALVSTASGTIYGWTSAAPLLPGTTVTLRIDGIMGESCMGKTVANQGWMLATVDCLGATGFATTATSFVDPPACSFPSVEAAVAITPPPQPLPGVTLALCESVVVEVTVTNTGTVDITGLTFQDGGILRVEGPGHWSSGPFPAMPSDLAVGASRTYTLYYTSSNSGLPPPPPPPPAVISGDIVLSGTLTGFASGVPFTTGPLVVTPELRVNGHTEFRAQLTVGGLSAAAQPRYVAGDAILYNIQILNQGQEAGANVIAVDTLPPDMGFVGCGGAPCSLEPGGIVVWTLTGTVGGNNGEVWLTLTVTAPGEATCPELVSADLCARAGCIQLTWTDLCGDYVYPWWNIPIFTPIPSPQVINAQIAPVVVTSLNNATQGATVYYSVVLNNVCTDSALNVVVWDSVPAGVTLPTPAGGTSTVTIVSWSVPLVPPGTSVSVSFAAVIASEGPQIPPDMASVSWINSAGRAQPLAVSPAVTVTVLGPAMTIAKTGPNEGKTDDFLKFVISVANVGTDNAYGVSVRDILPPELAFVSSIPAPASVSGHTVTWNLPDILPGGRLSVTVTGRGNGVEDEITIVNQAQVACNNKAGVAATPAVATKAVSLIPVLKIRVYPTPYAPATAVGGTLKFSGLTNGTIVRIYTVSGTLVRQLPDPRSPVRQTAEIVRHRLVWDGKTDTGIPVAPGLYLYVIEPPGGKPVRGNFGVIR